MKHITTSALCLLLIFSFFVSSVPRANAALSEEAKVQLKEILAKDNSAGGIMEVINYLYSIMYTDSMVGLIQPTSVPSDTNSNTVNTDTKNDDVNNVDDCSQAKKLTKNLVKGSVGPEVKTLQRLLNIVAFKKGLPYRYVSESGDGSFGNETSFFGDATIAALEKWQSNNDVDSRPGVLDAATRKAMVAAYCASPTSSNSNASSTPASNASEKESKKPVLTISNSSIKKGSSVTLAFSENGAENCNLVTMSGWRTTKTSLSEIENPYTVEPKKTSEYRLSCKKGSKNVYSDWVGVVVK